MFRFPFKPQKQNNEEFQSLKDVPVKELSSRAELKALKETGGLPWTSTLSVADWLNLRKLSLVPVGQVMGSSVYHIGWTGVGQGGLYGGNNGYGWVRSSSELREPTRALYDARAFAMERMQQEAVRLGANAIVDARLLHKEFSTMEHVVEFVCLGTAVRVEGIDPLPAPLVCSVSGSQLLRLLGAGAFPVGLAIGASYYYLATNYADKWQETSFANQEMTHFTNGFYDARHFAERRLREDAARLGADGVVGVDYTYRVEGYPVSIVGPNSSDVEVEDHIIEMVIFGSAISRSKYMADLSAHVTSVLDLRQ